MLKYTIVKLELLTEYDMLLMIEKEIRGGLTQASMRYAKANNEKTPDYDPTKPKSWLIYQDCNNLYGWAISQYIPYGGFKWVEPKLEGLDDLNDTASDRYMKNIMMIKLSSYSLVYYIQTDDFYNDLLNNPNLLNRMDTANLPRDHPCYIAERKKIPGLFSDETNERIMREFCALRVKSYSYISEDTEKIKAKETRGHVVRNHMTFQDHKRCLFGDASLEVTTSNVSIRSFKHKLKTIKSNKLTYNSFDDKRVILEDKVHTLAYGHYSIK
ncbi:Uncharacterized protein FWK35_00032501 [Aphis craccivora]|uniref:DNA pol B 2 domain-containing protein n=1 Tax=Aphis craccivora TaxID=307492 RepID=A0A6G0VX61_APHCR|nr:Uncharacterized protein FWK35_00032501 [Aphis craccivora]